MLRQQFTPESEKAFAWNALREVGRQKRRVVVAQFLAEPAKPSASRSGATQSGMMKAISSSL